MDPIAYRYRHMPIGGGGYVTGFYFHETDESILYCRTDIGGVYRFDYDKQEWISLIDGVDYRDLRECCPISVALDAHHPDRLYIASGSRAPGSVGVLTASDDRGNTTRKYELPFFVHGNLHGRSAGDRLIVDNKDENTLWMASQMDGLWKSTDRGESWQKVEAFPESGCTFVAQHGNMMMVGTEGILGRQGDMRGNSLYVSMDNGNTFTPAQQPEYVYEEGSKLHGMVAQRCSFDDAFAYVTYSANGYKSQNIEKGYTCDCGDCTNGTVVRYLLVEDGLGEMDDITPEKGRWGFSSMDSRHGVLITATIQRQHQDGDAVYISLDQGNSWKKVLHGLHTGRMAFRLSYMKPFYNGGKNIIHWMSDVTLDPHRKGTAWFNTGTGVFRTGNLLDETVVWEDWCDGMEETVHINVHAPHAGRVKVLDMIGDLGGFAFTDVDKHCEDSFDDGKGNRYITCLSCDWPDVNPDHIVVTARGNWTGKTKGGLIVSRDGAITWDRLDMPMGLSDELDELLTRISGINVNAGWVAVSADENTYVWAVSERIWLHARNVIVTHDQGKTFRRCRVLNKQGQPAEGLMKPLADRCDKDVFYGFGDKGQLYVSTDGGDTFREKDTPAGFPECNSGLVDCADQTEIRVEGGRMGSIYMATGEGLWKLHYDKEQDVFTGCRLTREGDQAFKMGLGLLWPDGDYLKEDKMVYFSGIIGGEYGFYRTPDDGKTICRINNSQQMYGVIHSVDGDKRTFGRFYLATGSSGLLYGDQV